MFRENVLIALTILITILSLCFVVLMTVFIQIHETEERLKRNEKLGKSDPQSTFTEDEQSIDSGWDGMQQINKEAYRRQLEDIVTPPPPPPPPSKTILTTTEPEPKYYGFTDSNYPEPKGAIRFPYRVPSLVPYIYYRFHSHYCSIFQIDKKPPSYISKFYGGSGHLTLEIPKDNGGGPPIDFSDDKILSEVTGRLYEYYNDKKIKDFESRVMHYNGVQRYQLSYYPLIGWQDGFIWFDKEALKKIVRTTPTPPEQKIRSEGNLGTTAQSPMENMAKYSKIRRRRASSNVGIKTF